MRFKSWVAAVALVLISALPVRAGSMLLTGAGPPPTVAATYQGPGDVASFGTWSSCARAYDAALASTSTSLCDLVAVTTPSAGAVICTLRASASGLVDLAASYCNGTTPAAACIAAGGCKVTKAYDQTGNGVHLTQATVGVMPTLTFGAFNGLPCVTFHGATADVLKSANFTLAQPLSASGVAIRTSGNTFVSIVGSTSVPAMLFNNAINSAATYGGTVLSATAADNALHAFQSVFNGGSSSITVDGSTTSGAAGSSGYSGIPITWGNFSGNSLVGSICEAGIAAGAFSGGNITSLNSNQHGANGYNF